MEVSAAGVISAFAAGVVSFLSPCVLPLVPGYVSYIAGQRSGPGGAHSHSQARLFTLVMSAFFALGFSSVFIALGASATVLGQLLLRYRYEANLVGGILVIVFGLFVTGILKPQWLLRDFHFHPELKGGKPLAAYVLGVAFGFGWTPCIGPILGAILTVSALSTRASDGVALLAIYSLGLAVPFLASAAFMDSLIAKYRDIRRLGRFVYGAAGAVMIVTGVAMITGQLSAFSFWLLDAFPVLGTIG